MELMFSKAKLSPKLIEMQRAIPLLVFFNCLDSRCYTLNDFFNLLLSPCIVFQCDFSSGTICPFRPSFTFQTLPVGGKAQKQNNIIDVRFTICFLSQQLSVDILCRYQQAAKHTCRWTLLYLPMEKESYASLNFQYVQLQVSPPNFSQK